MRISRLPILCAAAGLALGNAQAIDTGQLATPVAANYRLLPLPQGRQGPEVLARAVTATSGRESLSVGLVQTPRVPVEARDWRLSDSGSSRSQTVAGVSYRLEFWPR